jgi:DNA-binding NarL/FixJ family response regulator
VENIVNCISIRSSVGVDLVRVVRSVAGAGVNVAIYVGLSISLVPDSAGEPNYLISVVENITERKRAERPHRSLAARETEILRLLASGRTNREIAQQLNFSVSTVKYHVQHILTRLDASDRTQAAAKAAELGLMEQRD